MGRLLFGVGVIFEAVVFVAATRCWLFRPKKLMKDDSRTAAHRVWETSTPIVGSASLLAGIGAALTLLSVPRQLGLPSEALKAGHPWALMAAIIMAGVAGAIRFISEKLSWEAELHSYRETLATFELAQEQSDGFPPPRAILRVMLWG